MVSTQNTSEPSELEKAAYTVALDAYKQGGAKKAIAPMQNFIKNNPNSVYISNAYFWLAEFNLAIEPTNYAEAKRTTGLWQTNTQTLRAHLEPSISSIILPKKWIKTQTQANQYKAKLLKQYPKSEEASFFKK